MRDLTRRWRRPSGRAAVFAAGILLLAAPLDADEGGALGGEIDAIHQRYLGAFVRYDAAGIAGLFTADGIFVDPGGSVTKGRGNIEAVFAQEFGDPALALEAEANSIGALGDGAWDVGHGAQTSTDAAGKQRMPLHYLAVYERESGALRLRVLSVGAE